MLASLSELFANETSVNSVFGHQAYVLSHWSKPHASEKNGLKYCGGFQALNLLLFLIKYLKQISCFQQWRLQQLN